MDWHREGEGERYEETRENLERWKEKVPLRNELYELPTAEHVKHWER